MVKDDMANKKGDRTKFWWQDEHSYYNFYFKDMKQYFTAQSYIEA